MPLISNFPDGRALLTLSQIMCSAFVPRPVYAVLMLFPVTEPYEKERKHKDELMATQAKPDGVMFFKQTVSTSFRKFLSYNLD